MIAAIKNEQEWKSGNTEVVPLVDGVSVVYLHGHKIAEIGDDYMTIYDGGYQSTTTKSRLNALCDEFCISGESVFQKNFTWYVRKFVGCINGENIFQTEEFTNGYIFT